MSEKKAKYNLVEKEGLTIGEIFGANDATTMETAQTSLEKNS